MISTPVQFFIAWRIKISSRSAILPAIISFFAIASFGKLRSTSHTPLLYLLHHSWWRCNLNFDRYLQ